MTMLPPRTIVPAAAGRPPVHSPRCGRDGLTLLEVAIAAAVLGGALLASLSLIRQSYRQTALGSRQDLARITGSNVLTALRNVPFSALNASFGPTGSYRDQALESPQLRGLPVDTAAQGQQVSVDFRPAPGDLGTGYLAVNVSYPTPGGRDSIVTARTLSDPSLMGRVNTGDGVNPDSLIQRAFSALDTPSEVPASEGDDARQALDSRNRQALTALLERMPFDPVAKIIVRMASLDAADGKLDLDYSRFVLPQGDARAWPRVLARCGPDSIPDGLYKVRWEVASTGGALLTPGGHPATFTIYVLTAATGEERILVQSEEVTPAGKRLTIGHDPARDLGAVPIARVSTSRGLIPPVDQRSAHLLVTATRLFLLRDQFDQHGGASPFEDRMLVATRPAPQQGLEDSAAIRESIAQLSPLAGVRLSL